MRFLVQIPIIPGFIFEFFNDPHYILNDSLSWFSNNSMLLTYSHNSIIMEESFIYHHHTFSPFPFYYYNYNKFFTKNQYKMPVCFSNEVYGWDPHFGGPQKFLQFIAKIKLQKCNSICKIVAFVSYKLDLYNAMQITNFAQIDCCKPYNFCNKFCNSKYKFIIFSTSPTITMIHRRLRYI